MAIQLNDNLRFNAPKSPDDRSGKFVSGVWLPYSSVDEANASIAPESRYVGLEVFINVNNTVTEYWYKDGVSNSNLVAKYIKKQRVLSAPQEIVLPTDQTLIINLSANDCLITMAGAVASGYGKQFTFKRIDNTPFVATIQGKTISERFDNSSTLQLNAAGETYLLEAANLGVGVVNPGYFVAAYTPPPTISEELTGMLRFNQNKTRVCHQGHDHTDAPYFLAPNGNRKGVKIIDLCDENGHIPDFPDDIVKIGTFIPGQYNIMEFEYTEEGINKYVICRIDQRSVDEVDPNNVQISDVAISGTTTQGQVLTGSYTYTSNVSELNSVRTWYRANADGSNAETLTSSTGTASSAPTYTLGLSDVNKKMRLGVLGKATDGTVAMEEAFSSYTAVIAPLVVAPVTPAAPMLMGQDDTLNTFTFMAPGGYLVTDCDYTINNGSVQSATSGTINVGDIAIAVGGIKVYVRAASGRNKGQELSNTIPYTVAVGNGGSGEAVIGATKQTGPWTDPNTWFNTTIPATTTPVIVSAGHVLTIDTNPTIAGINVRETARLKWKVDETHTLSTNKNVIINGVMEMRPSSVSSKHTLTFTGINEANVVGSTMDPVDSDVGLWVMGNGRLDVSGSSKTPWTRTTSSVAAGATSFTVIDATGWQVGDEVVIVPTDQPSEFTTDWNDSTGTLIDSYFPKFERRTITAISGGVLTFATGLVYTHSQVSSSITSASGNQSRTWNPEVINLSRNVLITGTKDTYAGTGKEWQTNRRAHIFIRSALPQTIKYMQGSLLGPRKLQDGGNRPTLIVGRYGLHFHHCMDGSRGSLVEGCSLERIGNRGYVPHVSHGVTINNSTLFDCLGEGFFWDFQDITHNTSWTNNLIAATRPAGVGNPATSMLFGEGDFNVANNNVTVYGNAGEKHNNGGSYQWIADNESVWIFENNLAHSCTTGVNVWQNTGNNHSIINFDSYNCAEGISHGAYGNGYIYNGGYHYKSIVFAHATGFTVQNLYMDAGGNNYCIVTQDAPIPGTDIDINSFIGCVFRNYMQAPLELRTQQLDSSPEKQFKKVNMVSCDFPTGLGFLFVNNDLYVLANNNRVRVQPATGQAYQREKVSGTEVASNIAQFSPKVFGTGRGLKGDYYNGAEFNTFAFSRTDIMIRFGQFSIDPKLTPTGVSYLIPDNKNFSIRWTGKVEAQYSEPYVFSIVGSSKVRIWVNNVQILNSWTTKSDESIITNSSAISLTAGSAYDIKVEQSAENRISTIVMNWKSTSMPYSILVPMTQLYTP